MTRLLGKAVPLALIAVLVFVLRFVFTSQIDTHSDATPSTLYFPVVAYNPPKDTPVWHTLFTVPEQGAILSSVTQSPSGALYFATKRGVIYKYLNGETTLFLNMTAEVSSIHDRGLNALAASPDGRYLFVFYVRDEPNQVKDVLDERDLVLERISLINPQLRQVVLHGIPSTSITHTAGLLKFGQPNELFVGIGDDALNESDYFKLYALDIDKYYGKVLRINAETGGGFPDNPFYDGNPDSVRSKVYALGFRNPFSGYYDPLNNQLLVGDVGEQHWEELDLVLPGHNYGWPCYEGLVKYQYLGCFEPPHDANKDIQNLSWPLLVYGHDCTTAITGEARWQGKLLVADYGCGTIGDYTNTAKPATLWRFQYLTGLLPLANGDLVALQFDGSSGQLYAKVMKYSADSIDNNVTPSGPTYTIGITRVSTDTFHATAFASDGTDASDKVEWNAIMHHDTHIHPDYGRGTGAEFVLVRVDHPLGWVELCASLGASTNCIRVD